MEELALTNCYGLDVLTQPLGWASTAIGRLFLNLCVSLAEFELELIRERVKAGMYRAAKQGKKIGRPRVTVICDNATGFRDKSQWIVWL